MRKLEVRYDAPPTVGAFLGSDAFVRLIVGPIGSGKSSGCAMEIFRRAREQAPGPDGIRHTRFAVIRNTYRELRDTTRKTFEQWIPAPLGEWREQDFTFRMRFGDVDCEVLFRALDRPEDVKKLLSLELTGCYFNELREIAKPVFDGMQGRVGRFPSMKDGGATWFGVWADTNPMPTGHWAYKLFAKERPEGFELFEQPDGLGPDAENIENLPPGYYERLVAGKDKEWVDTYARGRYPSSDVGSIYGALLEQLRQRGGVCDFDGPVGEVFTTWDLGGAGARGDATAFWLWRLNAQRFPDLLGCYENHGLPLSHYFDELDRRAKERGYKYAKHWLPHDARQSPLVTGMSVFEMFCQKFGAGSVAIVPQMSLADGLQAGRWLLEQPMRIHATDCAAGLEALEAYHYGWDEANKVFSNKPVHDWSSHCFAPETEVLTRNGKCRIDMLQNHGEVLTPCGWKAYRNPRLTRRNAPLVAVRFVGGHTVRCTPDHLFLTESGWKSAESLMPGSRIRSSWTRSRSISMAASTVAGRASAIFRRAERSFIETCGRLRSALFRPAATFTIATAIPPTIGWATSNASRPQSILRSLGGRMPLIATSISRLSRASAPANGISPKRDAHGIDDRPRLLRVGEAGSANQSRAGIAASRFWRLFARTGMERSGVPKPARRLVIESVTAVDERSDVWDLTVPGAECFALANGAIVHNCSDAFRYLSVVAKATEALTRKPEAPKPVEGKPFHLAYTMDQLWEANKRKQRRERL